MVYRTYSNKWPTRRMVVDEGNCVVCSESVEVHQGYEDDEDGFDGDGNFIHGECRNELEN